MALKIVGSTSGNIAEVDASNQLKVAVSATAAGAGYVKPVSDPDNLGFRSFSKLGTISVGPRSLTFFDPVDGSTVNTNLWTPANVTMTTAVANGMMTLNSGAITTINTSAQVTTIKQAQFINTYTPLYRCLGMVNTLPEPNATIELGAFNASGSSAPTDGCFFRWNTAGEFRAVINFNGSETQSAALTAPTINVLHKFQVHIKGSTVDFSVDDVIVATVAVPAGQSAPVSTSRLPGAARVYTAGTVPTTGPQLNIAAFVICQTDLDRVKPWSETMAGLGRGSYQNPVSTYGQLANWANNTAPASATLSNTAAGYTTPGGLWQFAAPAGAATDFALFGYQVPPGFQLHVTRTNISSVNTGAAVATTATVLQWGIAVNSSAVSLATADSPPTSWGPRRVALGMQGYIVADPIGKTAQDIDRAFATPLVTDSGRFFHIICTVPIGTATASQVIRGTAHVEGYFE
jgi:hypothetical protein